MHIVIVGCGRVGAHLANSLTMQEHDVALIDKDPTAFAALGPVFNGITVTGVGIDEDVLRRAGIESADAFAAVTSQDSVNVVAAQIAKMIFHVPCVVGRINTPGAEGTFREFGIETVSPTNLGAQSLMLTLVNEGVHIRQSVGAGEVVLADVHVANKLVGRSLADIEIEHKMRISLVLRDEKAYIPDSGYVSSQGDVLLASIRRDLLATIRSLVSLEKGGHA